MRKISFFAIVAIFTVLMANLLAISTEQDNGNRPQYSSNRILIKLAPEAVSRGQLPEGLYAESPGFGLFELDSTLGLTGGTGHRPTAG